MSDIEKPCMLCGSETAAKRIKELEAEVKKLKEAAWAYKQLSMCYRVGRTPSEALFKRLEKASKALEGDA